MEPRRLRWIGALATVLYAFPLSVNVVTYAAHDVYHLRDHLGLVDQASTGRGDDEDVTSFVHQHGGAEHSHDRATDTLLGAAERTDQPADEHGAPTLELSGHVPAHVDGFAPPVAPSRVATADLPGALLTSPSPPPLPPPRA